MSENAARVQVEARAAGTRSNRIPERLVCGPSSTFWTAREREVIQIPFSNPARPGAPTGILDVRARRAPPENGVYDREPMTIARTGVAAVLEACRTGAPPRLVQASVER